MTSNEVKIGSSVVIEATDDFFAFIDQWKGIVSGWNSGYVVVHCFDSDDGLTKEFLVPPDQLKQINDDENINRAS